MKYKFSYHTDKGRTRKHNEDSVGVFQFENFGLFIVCDGVGGLDYGEVASERAVKYISEYFKQNKLSDIPSQLQEAFIQASKKIYNKSMSNMATTAVAALTTDEAVYIAHTGDSRSLLYHDGKIFRLTKDHSLVQKLVDEGILTPQEAELSNKKNIVTQVLGLEKTPQVDINVVKPADNDIIILCSDGLTNMLIDIEIIDILENNPIENIAKKLVDKANENGGIDNITVIAIEIEQSPYSQAEFSDYNVLQ